METVPAWLTPSLLWFLVGFLFIALEFVFPSLVKVFFGFGAWVVALLCFFIDLSTNTQLFIFVGTSILFLILLRRGFRRFLQSRGGLHQETEDIDEFIGQKAVVIQEISPQKKGRVEFRGTSWDAEAYETIPEGAPVEIIDKSNITLMVRTL